MRLFCILFVLLLFAKVAISQTLPGSLLLVGGGSENFNSWSDAPYQWAVEQSENKRVAVITYDNNPSAWLPDYFISLGATDARNFVIPNAEVANLQETYDSLVTYDVVFFKGGNQYNYYNFYKNTLTAQAIHDIFNSGGVIGGTSAGEMVLSGVLFTSENGTVYPEETIENPDNYYMTLEDDFLSLMPGYIFDSHVVERGRFARVIGFMGHWKLNHDQDIVGIGVDDKTAFCIDRNMTGYAFGTGAVGIYRATAENTFSRGDEKLLATNLEVTQLIHQTSVNLNDFTDINGFEDAFQPASDEEVFPGYVLMSGSDDMWENTSFVTHFADAVQQDSVLIFTGATTSKAQTLLERLEENETPAEIMQALPANAGSDYFLGKVERVSGIVFIDNSYTTLMEFIESGVVGPALMQQLQSGSKMTGFVGDNSRFAGGKMLLNYDQEFASYDGLLEFVPGLNLLSNMIIMPNTWEDSDIIENAAAGVPFGMVLDELKFGVWLHSDAFAEYKINDNGFSTITSYGSYPMILATLDATKSGFSPMSAVNSGLPRHVAGFELMKLQLMDESMEQVLGFVSSVQSVSLRNSISIHPNPASTFININADDREDYTAKLFSPDGRLLLKTNFENDISINISHLNAGVYFVKIENARNQTIMTQKLIIH